MKKTLAILGMAALMAVALAGCGGNAADTSSAASAASSEETATSTEEPMTGMPNPWTEAASAGEAAANAGLDGFNLPLKQEISLGVIDPEHITYRSMEGVAEAIVDFPAVQLTIRKGQATAAAEQGDISGDYNEYALNWTRNINGMEVKCFGNREDAADDACRLHFIGEFIRKGQQTPFVLSS